MKHTKKRNGFGFVPTVSAGLVVWMLLFHFPLKLAGAANCGHCLGPGYVYWDCALLNDPPCPEFPETGECLWESLPPGIYNNAGGEGCQYTYVDIMLCYTYYYTGDTTSRYGACETGCSCVLYGDWFEDHITSLPACNTESSCL